MQYLATEIFKVKNDLCPEIMKEIFIFHENPTYNLSSGNHISRRNIRTTEYGIETIPNLGAKIWDMLPEEIKKMPCPFLKPKSRNGSPFLVKLTRIPNLTRMSRMKCYWMLQNARVTALTVSELLRANQQPTGGKWWNWPLPLPCTSHIHTHTQTYTHTHTHTHKQTPAHT